jgi:toxin FitB
LSEARRPDPNRAVIEWLHEVDEDRAFISVISLAEIRRGGALMDKGRRRDALIKWLTHDLAERFAGRILAVDERVAFAWAMCWRRPSGAAPGLPRWTVSSPPRPLSTI